MTSRRVKPARVLVVDDDGALAEMLSIVLNGEGFDTSVCRTGDGVMEAFAQFVPDIVLLDRMLPGLDGMAVCRQIREVSGTPVVMLTAKGETVDIVAGLEAGADDYITKPFRNSELIARIRARLRTTEPIAERIEFGQIVMEPAAHAVTNNGKAVQLTPLEFNLLACLISAPQQVFTREQLLKQVWGYQHPGDTRLVNVHMTRLRQKIEDDAEDPRVIRTVRGVGYQAIDPISIEV